MFNIYLFGQTIKLFIIQNTKLNLMTITTIIITMSDIYKIDSIKS